MTKIIKPLIAGNWKMNGLSDSQNEISAIVQALNNQTGPACDCAIFPPATLIANACQISKDNPLAIGGQDCHSDEKGAFTGDISAAMLADAGAKYVLVGHSERRTAHRETDAMVNAKSLAALAAGLIPVICIGESENERENGDAIAVVQRQLQGSVPVLNSDQEFVIAYEPVWAIGTGKIPTLENIEEIHAFIRQWLGEKFGANGQFVRILYGGSMNPSNADKILPITNVNGGLIGGASLIATDFLAIASKA